MMKKDIEWLNEQVGELNSADVVFNESGTSYIDTAVSIERVYDLINQLEEPEVLSQEWIYENKEMYLINDTSENAVPDYKLKNLLVPKQELPVIPKYVAKYLELAKSDVSLKRVMELANTRYELPRWEKEYDWISKNSETFAKAWLDGYEVEEEPLYYAWVKGHDLMVDDDTLTFKYWNYDTFNGDLFPSNRFSRDGRFLIEMSKSEWNKVGINDSNADFVKVEE